MGHYRRGVAAPLGNSAGGLPIPPAPAAPVLSYVPTDTLTWTWSETNPYHWQIYDSDTGTAGSFALYTYASGTARTHAARTSKYSYIVGINGSSTEITSPSNIVHGI